MSWWKDTQNSWTNFWSGRIWHKPWKRRDDWLNDFARNNPPDSDTDSFMDINNVG